MIYPGLCANQATSWASFRITGVLNKLCCGRRITLNVWHPIIRSSSNKTQQQQRKEFGVGLNDTHFVNSGCCIQPCSRTRTHSGLRPDEHVALPGKWGSTPVLLASLQVAFPALLLLQAQRGPHWPRCCTLWWLALGEHPGDHAGRPPGWISKAFSHGLPCCRTSLYPWQVYSAIKPTRDLRDHLDYKSAPLMHLVLS